MPKKTSKSTKVNEEITEPSAPLEQKSTQDGGDTLEALSKELISTATSIQKQSEFTELRKSIFQLEHSIRNLQTSAKILYDNPTNANNDGCGCEKEEKCCVQLFISRVRVTKGQNLGDADKMELIFAVRALDMCGLLPGLTSYLKIDKDAGWIPAYSPIGKFCVPCNGKMTIPLTVEAMETGERGEGRPEYGSSPGSITLSCDCEIIPVQIPVNLSGGGVGKGTVEVEVSARKISGGCC